MLSILLCLTSFLTLFLWGTREGLLGQFINVSLGKVEGYGVPVWVLSNIGDGRNPGIDCELTARLEALDPGLIHVFPFRRIEGDVGLPGPPKGETAAWSDQYGSFYGRAVWPHDPLWTSPGEAASQNGEDGPAVPLEVVLNRKLLEQSLRCDAYRAALRGLYPGLTLPEEGQDALECLSNGRIWLDVRLGRGRRLVSFRIRWNDQIPSMESVAFLLPMRTYQVIELTQSNPGIRYFPEGEGEASERIAELAVWGFAGGDVSGRRRLDALARCLGGAVVGTTHVSLEQPRPRAAAEACAEASELRLAERSAPGPKDLTVSSFVTGELFRLEPSPELQECGGRRLLIPCASLSQRWREQNLDCDENNVALADSTATLGV
ncbi:MAG: hypothetical protein GY769_18145, partial [bacterium]|nr:hypothetical protein [bacterium]